MAEDLLQVPLGIIVDEGADQDDDDLSAAQIATLEAEISASISGVLDYLDANYLTGGLNLGYPSNIARKSDMIITPEGADAIAWTDADGNLFSGDLSNLDALDTATDTYEDVSLTTDPTNPQILYGTYSGGIAFIAVIVPTSSTNYDVLLFEYSTMFQSDTDDPDDVTTLAGVHVSVESDLSFSDFSQAVAGANQFVIVGNTGDPVQLLFTGDENWQAGADNIVVNTSATEMAAGEQGTPVGNEVIVDFVFNTAMNDELYTSTDTHTAANLDSGANHVPTDEFTLTIVNVNGGPNNRVDVETRIQLVDDTQQGALTDAAFYEQTLAGGLNTGTPDIQRIEVYRKVAGGDDILIAYLDEGGTVTYPGGTGDNAVGIQITDNVATVFNIKEDDRIKIITDEINEFNRVIMENVSDRYDFVGDTTQSGNLSNKKLDFGDFVVGGVGDETEPASLGFADDGPADDGGNAPIPVFEDGLTDGLSDNDGEVDGDGDVEGTSVSFDLNALGLVDAGADFPASWGLNDDATVIAALEAQNLESGDVALSYSILTDVNAAGDDVLTASAGATPVFRLTVGEDGSSLLELLQPLDDDPGGASNEATGSPRPNDEDFKVVLLGMALLAYDLEGDATGFDGADLTMVAEDDAPKVTAGTTPTALEVDETDFDTDANGDFSGAFSVAYGADGQAASDNLVYELVVGNSGVTGLTDSLTGQAVVLSVEVSTGDIVGLTDTDGDEVVRVSVDASGNVTLDQSRAVLHLPDSGDNQITSFAAMSVNLKATAKDWDNDTDSLTTDISALLGLRDDAPTIAEGADPTGLEVDETDFATNDTGDFSTAFNFTPPGDYGSDGPAASDPIVYELVVGNSGVSGLTDSLTGQDVVLSVELATGDIVGLTDTDGDEVVRVSVDASGNVTLNQSRSVLHLPEDGPNQITYFAADSVNLKATVTDKDFDDAEATKDISLLLGLRDDAPTIAEGADPTGLEVDETDFATDDTGDFSTAFNFTPPGDYGNDGPAASDPIVYELVVGNSGVSGLTDTLTGQDVVLSVELATGDIVGLTEIDEDEVVRISVDASGNVTLNQSRSVLHLPEDGPNQITYFAADSVNLKATVTDKDFDDAEATKDISLLLGLRDDAPTSFSPEALFVHNDPTGSDTSDLDSGGNMGNDLDGTAIFVNGTNGDPLSDFLTDGGSVGGLGDIFLFGWGTDVLTATSDSTNTDPTKEIFEITLDTATDLASIEMFQAIFALTNVPLDVTNADVSAGNPLTVFLPDLGTSTIDVQFAGYVSATQTTVNIKNDGVGVGNGQDFDVSGTDVDRLVMTFFDDNGNEMVDPGEEVMVNDLVIEVNQNNSPNDDGDMILHAYDTTGAEVQITEIWINGVALVTGGVVTAGGVPSNDSGGGDTSGPVTASAAGMGWDLDGLGGGQAGTLTDNDEILIGTLSGFHFIEIIADGTDANKDTYDILLQTIAIPTPNDIDFAVDTQLVDEDLDVSPIATLDVSLDFDGLDLV